MIEEEYRLLVHSIRELRPNAEYVLRGTSYDGLEWLDDKQEKPTEMEVTQKIEELRNKNKKEEYKRLRALEYPSIGDQLDSLFHAGVFPPEMAMKIQSVKDKYLKLTEK